jgi:hypothetical protein
VYVCVLRTPDDDHPVEEDWLVLPRLLVVLGERVMGVRVNHREGKSRSRSWGILLLGKGELVG